jgi:thiosulfate/3-mercaptopyruvate sulfurtransferase
MAAEQADGSQLASPIITVPELAALLAEGRAPVLLDTRWQLGGPPGLDSYRAGHLPGAVFVDLDAELSGQPGSRGRHPLPSTERFQAAMRRAGVRTDSAVVAYDEADSTIAARTWWLLRYFGHDDVRVLDGGLRAWAGAGHDVALAEPAPRPGDFTAQPGHLPVLNAPEAAALARSGLLLDARPAERYRGETEPVDPVAGHIPAAISAPTRQNVTASGRFLEAAQLRERFASLGARPAGPADTAHRLVVGTYCGSGVTAAHQVLALELAGLPAALYVGSWSEWVADPARPVATGAEPG